MNPHALTGAGAPSPALQSALRRARRRLVPFLILMYLLAYLDRSNVAYAKQALQATTGVSEAAFAFGAGIFFIGYALFEVPSNLILHRVGAKVWLARIMVTWGLLAACMAFAYTDTIFSTLRFFLGLAEAGFFPGVILYLTFWFPARERGAILGLFYLSQPLCFVLGGPLSGLLLDIDGLFGLHGWQLMFIVEGLAAAVVGVWAYFYLTRGPDEAHWMPEEERQALATALAEERRLKAEQGTVHLGKAFRDPLVVHFAATYFCIAMCGYGVAFYLPAQISALLGMKVGLQVSLVASIPWLCAFGACLFWPGLASRTGKRRTLAVISLLCAGLGMIAAGYATPLLAVALLCVSVAGLISAQPIFWTFPTGYLGGLAAAGGIALINAIGNLGGFVAPSLKVIAEAQTGTAAAGFWVIGGGALVAALLVTLIPKRADPAHVATEQGVLHERAPT
ncbi:MFS transporter [Pseudomonas sp. NPDC007930]|uniref:MFS transporter n=1 Tax=Pseudomonas sp. NPDC007930 TaxID=3364417 RepID=UPI0036EBEE94